MQKPETLPIDIKQSYILSGFTYLQRATEPERAKLKMLVGILSPRDLPEFLEAVDSELTAYDKFWVKYYQEQDKPYSVLRRGFIRYAAKEGYTHLAILPDDLIPTREGVDRLVENVVSNPKEYKVMMGCCNVQLGSEYLAVTRNLPSLIRKLRFYDWYLPQELQRKGRIVKVPHAGTPFAILSKKGVLDKGIMLEGDAKWNDAPVGYAQDVVLSHELARRKIPLYVDSSVCFRHLKHAKPGEYHKT